jgi:hypothetical protein
MRMKFLLAAILLSSPAAAQTGSGDDYCRDVQRLARGAEERPPFRSLQARGRRRGPLADVCTFNSLGGYSCVWAIRVPRDLTRESVARRIQACLPGATLVTDRDYLIVRSGRFVARVAEYGTERSQVGRTVVAYIVAEAAAGPSPR